MEGLTFSSVEDAPCFKKLDITELEILATDKARLEYHKSETLFKAGGLAKHIFFIIEGYVKYYVEGDPSRVIGLGIAGPGDYLGFSAVFRQKTYNYTATTLTPTKVCMIDRDGILKLFNNNHDFLLELLNKTYHTEAHIYEVLKNSAFKQMRGKVAAILIYLSAPKFRQPEVFEVITRHELADLAFVTVESAIRILKEFERENIIVVEGRNIEIVNLKKLEFIAENG